MPSLVIFRCRVVIRGGVAMVIRAGNYNTALLDSIISSVPQAAQKAAPVAWKMCLLAVA